MDNPFQRITNDLSEIKSLLESLNHQKPLPTPEEDLTDVNGAAKILNIAKASVYNGTSKNTIPHFKQGKKLYFSKAALLQYIKEGKKLTTAELKEQVNNTLHEQKNKYRSKGYTLPKTVKKFTSSIDIDNITTEEAAEEAGNIHFESNKDSINDEA
ncbi:helix-turn-helix domain-containing protein [Algibacter sp.]|nr:helix-turn-helix domain-containing protein [Algibacter sp.]